MDTRLDSFGVKNVFLATDRSLCTHVSSIKVKGPIGIGPFLLLNFG
jgi:hypothetical protein